MYIVLYQPQIPQNTGNIVRTCSVTGNNLILVRPLGFSTSDRMLKRSGLDYWEGVNVQIMDKDEFELWLVNHLKEYNAYFLSSKVKKSYAEVTYHPTDALIFGSETSGLPNEYTERWGEHYITLPMRSEARCLNLSNAVAITAYEAWRQQNFT
ncbi:MAG: hypothetical protein K0S74_101 [Chlamydiales bacterium]|jgi:tRNA (cytidine/uridine-2'-O-)-methyltransferase|nr:hypothetical protein [Chlamydiales bacterium]